jgi:hypothetical protein
MFGCMAFGYYRQCPSKSQYIHEDISRYNHSKDRFRIRGFHYDGYDKGKKTLSIRAYQFTVEKRKLGFFRLGLANVARLQDAVIDIYGTRNEPGESMPRKVALGQGAKLKPAQGLQANAEPEHSTLQESPEGFQADGLAFEHVSLEKAFTKEALLSFPVKGVSSIVIEPVEVNLHGEESLVTQISASSATIRLEKGDMLFEGNVSVVSGPKTLTTNRLILHPEHAIIQTDRHFVLNTPTKQCDGGHLTTDLCLRVIRMG